MRHTVICWVLLLLGAVPAAADAVTEEIRRRIEAAGQPAALRIDGDNIHAAVALPGFYERRGFGPGWSEDGRLLPRAGALLSIVAAIDAEGLRPADYHVARLSPRLATASADATTLAETDLLLSDAFLVLAGHLVGGRVDPATLEKDWVVARREVDVPALLSRVTEGEPIAGVLAELRPAHPAYGRLLEALGRYRALRDSGGWPRLGSGPVLKPGDRRAEVVLLRERLSATGDWAEAAVDDPESYDAALEAAVRAFQARHGLDADAAVGNKTREVLDVAVEERIRQIEINLERWRWLPRELGDRYVLVNVPEYRVRVWEDGREALSMRAVVGRTARRTPVFSDVMRYLVFSPSWEVPPTILRKDKLPELRRNPGYAAEQKMQVFRRVDGAWVEADPLTLDWANVGAGSIRLRQRPGPGNALGGVKFMFPNSFNVYLHDTPGREVFARADRDVSSGCIRLERPADLAVFLLEDPVAWSRDNVVAAMTAGQERTVRLPRPVPVHLQHWTAWTEDDGAVHFRRDLYGRDANLLAALLRASREAGATR